MITDAAPQGCIAGFAAPWLPLDVICAQRGTSMANCRGQECSSIPNGGGGSRWGKRTTAAAVALHALHGLATVAPFVGARRPPLAGVGAGLHCSSGLMARRGGLLVLHLSASTGRGEGSNGGSAEEEEASANAPELPSVRMRGDMEEEEPMVRCPCAFRLEMPLSAT